MASIPYFVFGALDVIAIVVLTSKMYKLSLAKHLWKMVAFAVSLSFFSYLMRVVFEIPQFDFPAQYVLMSLFFIFVLGVKYYHAAFIVGAGTTIFLSLQLTVYLVFATFGLANVEILKNNSGLYVHLLQFFAELVCIMVALYLHIGRKGFSFVTNESTRESKFDRSIVLATLLSVTTICLTIYFVYTENTLSIIIMAGASFIISYLLSHKRVDDHDREAFEAYIARHQEE